MNHLDTLEAQLDTFTVGVGEKDACSLFKSIDEKLIHYFQVRTGIL